VTCNSIAEAFQKYEVRQSFITFNERTRASQIYQQLRAAHHCDWKHCRRTERDTERSLCPLQRSSALLWLFVKIQTKFLNYYSLVIHKQRECGRRHAIQAGGCWSAINLANKISKLNFGKRRTNASLDVRLG